MSSLGADIIFFDIGTPRMDGAEAAQALAGKVHVVFVTAPDEYDIHAFEHGAVDYLLKPAEPERVAPTCQRLPAARLKQEAHKLLAGSDSAIIPRFCPTMAKTGLIR